MSDMKPARQPRLLILALALLVFQFSYAGPLMAGSNEEDYAAREAAAPDASKFAGGQSYDPDGISSGSMVWVITVAVIAVVLLIVLALAGLYDGPSAETSPSYTPPSGGGEKSWNRCVFCDSTGRQRRLVAQHDDGRREYVYDTCHMCKGAGGTWR